MKVRLNCRTFLHRGPASGPAATLSLGPSLGSSKWGFHLPRTFNKAPGTAALEPEAEGFKSSCPHVAQVDSRGRRAHHPPLQACLGSDRSLRFNILSYLGHSLEPGVLAQSSLPPQSVTTGTCSRERQRFGVLIRRAAATVDKP